MPRIPLSAYGFTFIESDHLPEGVDEYYLRDSQIAAWGCTWRNLAPAEILRLEQQGNVCPDWSRVLVEDPFDVSLIKDNAFYGLVRIGSMEPYVVGYHDFLLPEGIRDSHIISCDIGRHCAIHRCAYMAHYIIGEGSILSEVDELDATNHCKAGVGVVMEGESEDVRIWLSIMNEAEGRSVLPFEDLICADAWLWGTYREHKRLMEQLVELTGKTKDLRRGRYGVIGEHAVIKTCRVIKDVNIGPYAYIKGANKLKNLTIKSQAVSPSQIGEGVELVNGIIGYGCHVFYGVKAVRFVMGNNSNLKYGARLLNSVLGDNSTISCCEVLNSLVFPFHEQHHNNSFLIAALVQGQSNMAAGANIGSNHNTRGNDGEFIARRGFWPALSSTIKYNSCFAPFAMVTKGSYPNEMDIPLPFSLVSFSEQEHCLIVIPAYWWMYNRYALERNDWKFHNRDKRKIAVQHIETDYLAPDILESIEHGMHLLEVWTGQSALASEVPTVPVDPSQEGLAAYGKRLLEEHPDGLPFAVVTTTLERSAIPSRIHKVSEAYRAYREMMLFACGRTLLSYLHSQSNGATPRATLGALEERMKQEPLLREAVSGPFVNMGGQIVSEPLVKRLIASIEEGSVDSWQAVHAVYDRWWNDYATIKALNALVVLQRLEGKPLDGQSWSHFMTSFASLCDMNAAEVYKTRKKDFEDSFRHSTYRNDEEMAAVLGKPEEAQFVKESRLRMNAFQELVNTYSRWE